MRKYYLVSYLSKSNKFVKVRKIKTTPYFGNYTLIHEAKKFSTFDEAKTYGLKAIQEIRDELLFGNIKYIYHLLVIDKKENSEYAFYADGTEGVYISCYPSTF